MFRFSTDVGHTGFLVFKEVEYFALHYGVLDFVVRKRGVKLLLLCSLRTSHAEAGLGEQRFGVVVCFHAGAAGKESDTAGGQNENQALVGYFRFHGLLCIDRVRLVSRERLNRWSQ